MCVLAFRIDKNFFMYYNYIRIYFRKSGDKMSNKKTLFKLSIAVISLFVIGLALFTLFVYVIPEKDERVFSEQEIIDVNIENKEIIFFETNEFIGKNKTEIYDKLNNVILVEDDKITMNDIILFQTNGNFILNFDNENIISGTFISMPLSSAQDLDYVFKNISKIFAEKNKLTEEKIYIIDKSDNKNDYISFEQLYDTEKHIYTEYKNKDIVTVIKSKYSNNNYYLELVIKKNP